MQLVKLPTQTGSYRYSMPTLKEINVEKKLSDTLSESYVSSAQNRELCVFKVLPGSGPAVANLIEQAKYPEVFATLGDDATVMIFTYSEEDAIKMENKLLNLINIG